MTSLNVCKAAAFHGCQRQDCRKAEGPGGKIQKRQGQIPGRITKALCPGRGFARRRLSGHPDPVPDHDRPVLYGHQSPLQRAAHRLVVGHQGYGASHADPRRQFNLLHALRRDGDHQPLLRAAALPEQCVERAGAEKRR